MNSEEIVFDNLLDSSVDGNVFLEDLIDDPSSNVLEQAMKENMMEVWNSNDYELLNSPLTGELQLENVAVSGNYMDWINWEQKLADKGNTLAVPTSNSSDSGLSGDFNYDQQLSPNNELDRSSPHTAGSSICSNVDVDSDSSPDTLCPSSPCSDINMTDDPLDIAHPVAPTTNGKPANLVFLKDLNLREIKAVKIIRNGSTLVSGAASAVLGGIKSTSAHVPDAIKKLLGPGVQLSVASSTPSATPASANGKSAYPPIILSDEERRLLAKEGVELPTHYPLTKHEERELKRIRRKIRNKISAQDSRKRKRVYMDGLEDRVKACADENSSLQKRIRLLETENKSLVSQLKRLQSIITGQAASNSTSQAASTPAANANINSPPGQTNNTAQPATCLMVLMLSFALFLLPNLRPGESGKNLSNGRSAEMTESMMKMPPFAGRSRALLQDTLALEGDSEMTEMELEMSLGGEVILGEETEDEEGGLYVPLPLDSLMLNPNGGGKSLDVLSKVAGWGGQKFGKQYPANAKRSVPAFLVEHDYHATDATSKRARFRDGNEESEGTPVASPATPVTYSGIATKELNQSQLYEELAELARGQQNIVHVRISSEEL